jgi:hypothetical protein
MSEQHVLAIGFLERATCSAKRFIVFVIGVLAFLPIPLPFAMQLQEQLLPGVTTVAGKPIFRPILLMSPP